MLRPVNGKADLFSFSVLLINLSSWSSQGLHILGWYKCVCLSKLGIALCSVLAVCGPVYLIFFLIVTVHTHHREKPSVLWTLNYQQGWLQAFSCWFSASSSEFDWSWWRGVQSGNLLQLWWLFLCRHFHCFAGVGFLLQCQGPIIHFFA